MDAIDHRLFGIPNLRKCNSSRYSISNTSDRHLFALLDKAHRIHLQQQVHCPLQEAVPGRRNPLRRHRHCSLRTPPSLFLRIIQTTAPFHCVRLHLCSLRASLPADLQPPLRFLSFRSPHDRDVSASPRSHSLRRSHSPHSVCRCVCRSLERSPHGLNHLAADKL